MDRTAHSLELTQFPFTFSKSLFNLDPLCESFTLFSTVNYPLSLINNKDVCTKYQALLFCYFTKARIFFSYSSISLKSQSYMGNPERLLSSLRQRSLY
jgi:hypothetical protein